MSVLHEGRDDQVKARTPATILVEFGPLTLEQQAMIDLHTLRAVGTDPPKFVADNGVVIEFWLRAGDTVESLYDDIRGWAIGNCLPVRGIIED